MGGDSFKPTPKGLVTLPSEMTDGSKRSNERLLEYILWIELPFERLSKAESNAHEKWIRYQSNELIECGPLAVTCSLNELSCAFAIGHSRSHITPKVPLERKSLAETLLIYCTRSVDSCWSLVLRAPQSGNGAGGGSLPRNAQLA